MLYEGKLYELSTWKQGSEVCQYCAFSDMKICPGKCDTNSFWIEKN